MPANGWMRWSHEGKDFKSSNGLPGVIAGNSLEKLELQRNYASRLSPRFLLSSLIKIKNSPRSRSESEENFQPRSLVEDDSRGQFDLWFSPLSGRVPVSSRLRWQSESVVTREVVVDTANCFALSHCSALVAGERWS